MSGEYEGSTEVELATQEAAQIYEAVEQGGGDMNALVTISRHLGAEAGRGRQR